MLYRVLWGLEKDCMGYILGFYRDSGKGNGSYYSNLGHVGA